MTTQETTPIAVELLEIEGDTDRYALITVTSDDDTVIEVQYDLNDLNDLIKQASGVARTIVWHRAEWTYTTNYGRRHLARKGSDRVLCGSRRDVWDFSPFFRGYYIGDACKRCLALFEKATA